jgi:hypothetical protein
MNQTQPVQIQPPEAPRERLPRWLLLAALLHGLAYLLLLPPWMGEDEPWHVEYVHHVADGHMPWGGREVSVADLPEYSPSQVQALRELGGLEREDLVGTQTAILDSMRAHNFWKRVDWASWGGGVENFDQVSPYFTATHQPPAYYLVLGSITRLFGGGDVLREMWVGRCFALLCYLAVVAAAWALARRVCADRTVAILCAFLVAWWPMHARQAAVVNNDVLVKVLTAWTLVVALDIARLEMDRRRVALALLLAAGGLAVKTTATGVLLPLGVAILAGLMRGQSLDRGRGKMIAGLLVVALMLLVPFGYVLSNNPAIPLRMENFLERLHRGVQLEFLEEFARTAVGAFNWYSRDLPAVLHSAVRWVLLASGLGLFAVFLRRRPELHKGLAGLCVVAVIAQLTLVVLRGTAAGRYAMPVLPAFALLACAGLLLPLPRTWRPGVAVVVSTALIVLDAYFLWSGLVWNQYGVWGS